MNITIETVHFSISEQLQEFTTKKATKAFGKYESIISTDVMLKVVKPEARNNKEAEIRVTLPGVELFAKKTADSFEEAIDNALDAVNKQIKKHKEKAQAH